jgi:hypothetical protein
MITKEIPIINAPINTYCLRLPQTDLVLSDIKPMMGSKNASNILGTKNKNPHIHDGIPKFSTNTTIKIPKAAGNIWLANIPNPNAIFCPIGTISLVFVLLFDMFKEF